MYTTFFLVLHHTHTGVACRFLAMAAPNRYPRQWPRPRHHFTGVEDFNSPSIFRWNDPLWKGTASVGWIFGVILRKNQGIHLEPWAISSDLDEGKIRGIRSASRPANCKCTKSTLLRQFGRNPTGSLTNSSIKWTGTSRRGEYYRKRFELEPKSLWFRCFDGCMRQVAS